MASVVSSTCLRLPQGAASTRRSRTARQTAAVFKQPHPLSARPAQGARLAPLRQRNRGATHVTAAMPAFDVSFAVLPNLVPILLRATTAGVMFYATMNWALYRRVRKEAEKGMEQIKEMETERKERLKRLGPSTDKGSDTEQ